jgi:anti-sigma regulatory factor (Ser/Thr protein kinase)
VVSHAGEVVFETGCRVETREDSRRGGLGWEGIERVVRGWLQEDRRGLLG